AWAIRLVASLIVLVPAGDWGERVRETHKRSANALAGPWQSRLRLDRAWFAHGGSGSTRAARCRYGMAAVRPGIPGRHDRPANLVVALPRAFCAAPALNGRSAGDRRGFALARPARFELTTSAFGGQGSIQLSYGRAKVRH